ncbi:hypothetical protein MRS44_003344 [Fusarium solani]|uniref:uncharacterized protein n=1 Tax=Fusarium solani TaxID=169388 RepID=UPI0032C3DB9A|nr:hypothetical protein MRS44_003344 [Fusarium solani]
MPLSPPARSARVDQKKKPSPTRLRPANRHATNGTPSLSPVTRVVYPGALIAHNAGRAGRGRSWSATSRALHYETGRTSERCKQREATERASDSPRKQPMTNSGGQSGREALPESEGTRCDNNNEETRGQNEVTPERPEARQATVARVARSRRPNIVFVTVPRQGNPTVPTLRSNAVLRETKNSVAHRQADAC